MLQSKELKINAQLSWKRRTQNTQSGLDAGDKKIQFILQKKIIRLVFPACRQEN